MDRERMERLRRMFYPESVAVVGASANPQKWGFSALHNLLQGKFPGKIYPVNLSRDQILGVPCYKTLGEIPGKVDLVMIIVPPENLTQAIDDTIRKRAAGVVVLTAGLGEVSEDGKQKEAELAAKLGAAGVEGLGPNCQGIFCTQSRLFAQYVFLFPEAGKISLLSQSGNVGASTVGSCLFHGVGFGKFINYGNEAMTPVHELLDYLTLDPDTSVIAIYIEGPKDGRAFFEALGRATVKKPVVILKGGITEAGSRAVSSHTGAMSGRNEIFFSACEQAGAIVTPNLDEFFFAMVTFAGQPIPKSNKIGVVTWGGGWGVLAADECARCGLDLAPLPEDLSKSLGEVLASRWSRNNPVDLATSGGNRALTKSLELVAKDPLYAGVIHIGIGIALGAKAMVDQSFFLNAPEQAGLRELFIKGSAKVDEYIANAVIRLSHELDKPVLVGSDLASVPGPDNVAWRILKQDGRVIYPTPNSAARAMNCLVKYGSFLRRKGLM